MKLARAKIVSVCIMLVFLADFRTLTSRRGITEVDLKGLSQFNNRLNIEALKIKTILVD